MEIRPATIPGCYEIITPIFSDERGSLVKTFNSEAFAEYGFGTEWHEEYYSISKQRVLRGLHFQLPPHDHKKLVYCTAGTVLDVVVDLRIGSPAYGEHALFTLSGEKANMIYIPRGMAHGFYVLSDVATMLYKVSSVYAPEYDSGIHWASVGMKWPDASPVLSIRDSHFSDLKEFESPFVYNAA
jgi:dTDP-4-dehydrorhamnose 3,5-epimerase